MKVLIVNERDTKGGAARSAYRLHGALKKEGIDSSMLVQVKSGDDAAVLGPEGKLKIVLSMARPTLDAIPQNLLKYKSKTLFSQSWLPSLGLINKINQMKPDVVHLHWITGGMIRIEDLPKIKAPIIWTMHDNWAFTGGCHIAWQCEAYLDVCGQCPNLGSVRQDDLSNRIFLRKQKIFSKMQYLSIIGPSKWISDCARRSALLKNHQITWLPNLIDTNLYAPFNKYEARKLIGLDQGKKIIGFGAISATSDVNKGFRELSGALKLIEDDDVELVIFGATNNNTNHIFRQIAHYKGVLHDDISLRVLYSSVDVLVVPSIQENLSNVIMECLACGTPVVAFDVGGNSEMIEHLKNGYLARPFDMKDLANGIKWIIKQDNIDAISKNAREKIVNNFSVEILLPKYIKHYKDLISKIK